MVSCSLWRLSQRARGGLSQPLYEICMSFSSWQRGHTRLRKIHCSTARWSRWPVLVLTVQLLKWNACKHNRVRTRGDLWDSVHTEVKPHLNCRLQFNNAFLGGGRVNPETSLHHIAPKTAGTGSEQSEDGGKKKKGMGDEGIWPIIFSFHRNWRTRCKCHSFEKSSKVQVLPPYISLTLVNVVAMAPGYLPTTLCTFAEIIRSISQWKGKTA